jgi:hypothetical protein
MKKSNLLNGFILVLLSLLVSSCNVITDIFNMGMGYGLFIVLAILVLIIGIVMKLSKK